MTAKFEWEPYLNILLDDDLSALEVSEALEKQGISKSKQMVERARKERGFVSKRAKVKRDVSIVLKSEPIEQSKTPEPSPMKTKDENKPDDFSLVYETPKSKRRGKPAKLTPEQAGLHQMARYNAAAAVEAANPEKVARLKEVMGETFTVEEVAAALGCTVRAVQNYLKSGRLRGVKVAGAWAISAENFKRFFDGQ